MLDGLIGSLADLNQLIADAAFKDSTINGMVTGIGKDKVLAELKEVLSR